jgi:hemerythrin
MPTSNLEVHATEGIEGMEREHALEVQMVRALQAALASGDRAKVIVLMDELEVFANAHFLAEQHLMRLHAYPGYEAHEVEHDRLIAELRELSSRVLAHPDASAGESVAALEKWLLHHIHTEDESLAEFLRRAAGDDLRR